MLVAVTGRMHFSTICWVVRYLIFFSPPQTAMKLDSAETFRPSVGNLKSCFFVVFLTAAGAGTSAAVVEPLLPKIAGKCKGVENIDVDFFAGPNGTVSSSGESIWKEYRLGFVRNQPRCAFC